MVVSRSRCSPARIRPRPGADSRLGASSDQRGARAVSEYAPRCVLRFRRAAAVERSVDRTEPVSDVILKTRITGAGHTVGRVGAELIPNEQLAEIDLITTGTTNTQTVGVNGPVQLYSDSTIPFQIHQRVYSRDPGSASLGGVCAPMPIVARALNGLSTDLHCLLDRVVKKAACKKYQKNHDEADEIASRHAEQGLAAGRL